MSTEINRIRYKTLYADRDESVAHSKEQPAAFSPALSPTQLAIEEPLEIRLEYWANGKAQHRSVSITMRTPGHDLELAAGFLFTEGIIAGWDDIKQVRPCGPVVTGQDFQNIVRVEVHPAVLIKTATMDRNFYTTSSCGICGKTSIDALKINNQFGRNIQHITTLSVTRSMLYGLPARMTAQQTLFRQTGGCHASGLFDATGNLLCVREDVGRHNALDKVIGWALMNRLLPLHDHVVLVSGRASFELMQKSSMGGIPFVAALGAPSTLAVQMAQEFNMTLVGLLHDQRMTIYHDPGRMTDDQATQSGDTLGRTTQRHGSPLNLAVGNPDRRFPRFEH